MKKGTIKSVKGSSRTERETKKPMARESKRAVKNHPSPTLVNPSLGSYPLSGPIAHARRAVNVAAQAVAGGGLRSAFDRLTTAVDTQSIPAVRPHALGLHYDSKYASLEPSTAGSESSAAVAVSDMTKRYTKLVGSQSNLRLSMCQPLCHISSPGSDPVSFPDRIFMFRGSTDATAVGVKYANAMSLNPLRFGWYGQNSATQYQAGVGFADCLAMGQFASSFSRWRVVGNITFHYEPQSSTSLGTRLEFSYTEDPGHNKLGLNNLTNTPTSTYISATPYSVAFAPWTAWSMSVPAANDWRYTMCPVDAWYKDTQTTTGFVSSDIRQSQVGCIAGLCMGSGGVGIYGRLMIEWELEFSDPAPYGAGFSLLHQHQLLLLDDLDDETKVSVTLVRPSADEEKLERKDDESYFALHVPSPASSSSSTSSSTTSSSSSSSSLSLSSVKAPFRGR